MDEYIRNICIFVCLCDFISQLFLSEKFMGLYRNISGVFVILFLLYPFGRKFIDITEFSDQELMTQFEENLQKSGQIWDISSENKNMNEISEESQKLLEQYIQDAVDEYAEDETKIDKFEKDSFDADSFETDSFEVEE
ncbi:MAG: hypothetical protein ACI4DK_02410 [Lachnospiraceae bacterium]